MPFAPIPDVLAEIRKGRMIILCDDEDRENEGDLCMAAEKVTPEAITFMARFGCGLICMQCSGAFRSACTPAHGGRQYSQRGTAFTVSIDARDGITTGISSADRAHTILKALDCRPRTSHALGMCSHYGRARVASWRDQDRLGSVDWRVWQVSIRRR